MRIPSPLPKINLQVVLEVCKVPYQLLFLLWGGSVSYSLDCSHGCWLLWQNSLMGVFHARACPGMSALPPRWAEANTWENSSSHSSAGSFAAGQRRSAEPAAWKRPLPAGSQLRRSTRNPAIPFFQTAVAISLLFRRHVSSPSVLSLGSRGVGGYAGDQRGGQALLPVFHGNRAIGSGASIPVWHQMLKV